MFSIVDEMTKITNSIQYHKSYGKYRSENGIDTNLGVDEFVARASNTPSKFVSKIENLSGSLNDL
jgi:hypothetical protein